MNTCQICGKEITENATTCSSKCRQKLYRRRKKECNVTASVTPTQTAPDGYIMVPRRDWDRLMEMVTDLTLRQSASPKSDMSGKDMPIPKPIDTSDIVVEVKKQAGAGSVTSQNFMNSFTALMNG